MRFVVKNGGKVMHEMVIGTMKELKEHAEMMRKHPGMQHEEPYIAHVAPGKTETITWQFTKAGDKVRFKAEMIGKEPVITKIEVIK